MSKNRKWHHEFVLRFMVYLSLLCFDYLRVLMYFLTKPFLTLQIILYHKFFFNYETVFIDDLLFNIVPSPPSITDRSLSPESPKAM